MKRFLLFLSLNLISFFILQEKVLAQALPQLMNDLKEKLGEITIDRITYNQSVELLDESKGKVRYESVAVSEKGESNKVAYDFYISDIDKNTLIRKPSGKKFFVSLELNNKQRFIKYYKDDKFEAYTDNAEILVLGADIAQEVVDILKSAIPLVKTSEKTWNTASDALKWLTSGIGEVKDKSGIIQQSFITDNTKSNLVSLTVKSNDSKGSAIEEKYDWNLLDVNKNKLSVKVSGTTLSVSLEIKNGDKYIRHTKANELQNFTGSMEIACEDIDQARNIISALSIAIDKSKPEIMEFKTSKSAMDYIKANIGDISADQKTKKQKIDFSQGSSTKCNFETDETDSKGKTVGNQYEFYLADVEPNVVFKVSGKKILIPVIVSGKNKFVRYTKDNILQNYVSDVEIYSNDIETARNLATAFNTAIKGSIEVMEKFANVSGAIKFLQTNIGDASIGGEQYKQTFESQNSEPFASTYSSSVTEAKGITSDESFLFYPYMLDPNSVRVETKGKYLTVTTQVMGKKPMIKKIKKDQSVFTTELSIMSFDVKKAQDLVTALKYLIINSTPKANSFENKEKAIEYLKQNLGEIAGGGKTIKQKLDLTGENLCKATITINTTDDKGKTTEQIFEFSLSDINKQLIDFKTQGAIVAVNLICKNKQKLIKVYRDGVQQSFSPDAELLCSDVEVAKNLAEALKSAVTKCE